MRGLEVMAAYSCFHPLTQVLTSRGYKAAKAVLDTTARVWTGSRWVEGMCQRSRRRQEMVTLTLTGRKTVTCCADAVFLLENGERVEAGKLQFDQQLYCAPKIIEEGISFPDAYTLGLLYGDGTFHERGSAEIILYGPKENFLPRIEASKTKPSRTYRDRKGFLHCYFQADDFIEGRTKDVFPVEVYDWNVPSRLAFLAGLLDTDGNDFNGICRMNSKHRGFLEDTIRMAETLGLTGALNIASKGSFIGTPMWMMILRGEVERIPLDRLKVKNKTIHRYKVVSVEKAKDKEDGFSVALKEDCLFQCEGLLALSLLP